MLGIRLLRQQSSCGIAPVNEGIAMRRWDYEHGRWTYLCVDPVHVWPCEHAAVCQCGTVTREIATCAVCGK